MVCNYTFNLKCGFGKPPLKDKDECLRVSTIPKTVLSNYLSMP